jgi:hypothetical protein
MRPRWSSDCQWVFAVQTVLYRKKEISNNFSFIIIRVETLSIVGWRSLAVKNFLSRERAGNVGYAKLQKNVR